jgi:small conductance mechanosensitive channel
MSDYSNEVADQVVLILSTYGLKVVGAVAVLLVGLAIAGWTRRIVTKFLSRTERVDPMLTGFFASLAKYLVLAITVIAVLNQFGVQTTSLIAVLGAAGLAIGLALQGTLSNVAAGVMLLFFRPFKIGDYIDASGITGTVKSVGLFVTELATPDNVHIVAPNAQLWGTAIHNYSHNDTRRVDLVVGVAYEDDVEKALAILLNMGKADERVHADPEPFAAVAELADSSVNVTLRVWCDADNYWPLKFDLTKAIKASLDREGISIPYPQSQVHLSQAAAE